MTVGERIKRLRKEQRWTQAELASKVGVQKSNICRWESGQSWPSGKALEKVAEAFGVPMEELFGPRAEEKLENDALRRQFLEIQELSLEDQGVLSAVIEAFLTKKRIEQLLVASGRNQVASVESLKQAVRPPLADPRQPARGRSASRPRIPSRA